MQYEIRWPEPHELHPELRSALEAWRGDSPSQAVMLVDRQLRRSRVAAGPTPVLTPNDWLFLISLTASAGMFEHDPLVTRRARALHPDSAMLCLLEAWDLSAQAKFFECRERLEPVIAAGTDQVRAAAAAIDCYNDSIAGWRKSAERKHHNALPMAGDDPWCLYILSRAAARRTGWELSAELGRRVVELAPLWSRARAALMDSLLARGQLGEVRDLIEHCPAETTPCFTLDMVAAILHQVSGDLPGAIAKFRRLLARWPFRSRSQRFATYQLTMLLMETGDDEAANEVIRQFRLRRMNIQRTGPDNRQRYLSLALVSQNHNHCVPTAAAMVAGAQGQPADPESFAIGMRTGHGTPMWRMVDYMRSIGFQPCCVQPTIPAIETMLEHGVPLIGSLNGLFNSHVDILCGYDSGLQIVHVRDPMHWFGRPIRYASIARKYRESEGLWALVAPGNQPAVDAARRFLDPVGQAIIDLARACAQGDRVAAETAYRQIPDDHPLVLARDSIARGMAITPDQFEQRLKAHAVLTDDEDLNCLRAVLWHIEPDNADEVAALFEAKRDKYGGRFVDFVRGQCLIAKQEWAQADAVLKSVARQLPQFDSVWSHWSEVQEQLGQEANARQSLEIALDISPDDLGLNKRAVDIAAQKIPFAERKTRVEQIAHANPDQPNTCFMLEEVLRDSGDGLEYEQILKRCLKYYPRNPWCYHQLANWYLAQQRDDLAGALLRKGRALIGAQELPLWDFEEQAEAPPPEGNNHSSSGSPPANRSAAASTSDPCQVPTAGQPHAPDQPSAGSSLVDESPADRTPTELETTTAAAAQLLTAVREAAAHLTAAELLATAPVEELRQRERTQKLGWHESVHLHALLVRRCLMDLERLEDARDEKLEILDRCLPSPPLPGIAERYAQALLSALDGLSIHPPVARRLLDWSEQQCPQRHDHADLEFERAWLLELAGRWTEAEQTLERIVKQHPAFATAWFRLASIHKRRENLARAWEALIQCVTIQPGNLGALEELARLSAATDPAAEPGWRERLSQLMPYSAYYHYLAASAAGRQAKSPQVALDRMEQAKRYLTDQYHRPLTARLLVDFERFQAAWDLVADVQPIPRYQTAVQWIRAESLMGLGRGPESIAVLEQMLQDNPADGDVAEQLARSLHSVSPERASEFAARQLRNGLAIPLFAHLVLGQADQPLQVAIDTVQATPADQQADVARAFSRALNDPATLQPLMQFLGWVTERFPWLVDLHEMYAVRLMMQNQNQEAARIGKELVQRFPDEPRWLRLAGICLQDVQPKESLEYLGKEFEITGSADCLTRMARGHQLMRNTKQARQLYFQALQMNPCDSLAITNLVTALKVMTESLLEGAFQAIRYGEGRDAQYFLVTAVQLAIKFKREVPPEWYPLAVERLNMAIAEGGFRDEIPRLERCLAAWTLIRPQDRQPGSPPPHFLARLRIRWAWPKTAWVPRMT